MLLDLVRHALPAGLLRWPTVLLFVLIGMATLEGVVRNFGPAGGYDWRGYAASLADAIGRRAVDAPGVSLAAPVLAWAHAHRVTTLHLGTPLAFVLLFLGQEFCYYWYHRMSHRVRWFWATHAVHHSPNQLSLAAALRLGWTGRLTGTTFFFAPLVWLGFAPMAVVGALAVNVIYQYWLHAPWMPRLGPFEWVFNTPSHHKVHHASNPEYLDRNYGGVLIVFDRLFGTFAEERPGVAIRYGLTTPLRSHNPLYIAFHAWHGLVRDLWNARGWRARFLTLFSPPKATP
jgi:sterol desaturase/sphingolipid hydroxylase (fatty acid hydroxylase superfamily)